VRGDISPEAGVIGGGATGLRHIEPFTGAGQRIMFIVGPRQVLGILAAGDALPIPGGQGHDPATAP